MKYQKLVNSNIRNMRRRLNLTQEEFAERIKITVQGLSNIERNRYMPSPETIDSICEEFNISPIQLLWNGEHANNQDIINDIESQLKFCSRKELLKISEIIKILISK